VELWEVVDGLLFDDDGVNSQIPIVWSFESPVIFNHLKEKPEYALIQLKEAELYFSDLVGTGSFKVYWRQDYSTCWHLHHQFTVKNSRIEPSYFMRAGCGEPTIQDLSDALDSTPANVARFFQFRIEISGSLTFKGFKAKAALLSENIPAQVICD